MKWHALLFTVFIVSTLSTTYCTQAPQEEKSVALVAKSVNCVDSGEKLYHKFLQRGRASGRYLFDVQTPGKQLYTTYTTFTVVYNTTTVAEGAHSNATTLNAQLLIPSDKCCNPSNEGCIILQTAFQTLYGYFPAKLVYMLEGTWIALFITNHSQINEFIGCWSTPPFCSQSQNSIYGILKEFTAILIHTSQGTPAKTKFSLKSTIAEISSSSIYFLSALASLLTLPPALMLLKRYKPSRNKPVPALWLGVQINSWVQFLVHIASYQVSFNKYDAYLSDAPREVLSTLWPYATFGNYFVIALGVIFALELPFVLWYIAHKVLTVDARQTRCSSHCIKIANCFGLTGIVFFLQIVGGSSVYILCGLLAFPLAAVYSLALYAVAYILFTALIAIVIYPCMARTFGRSCFQGCGVLLYIFLGAVCAVGFIGLLTAVVADNFNTPLNSYQIGSSIITSGLFALMAYIAKKTLWHRLWQPQNAEREDEETPLLRIERAMQNEN